MSHDQASLVKIVNKEDLTYDEAYEPPQIVQTAQKSPGCRNIQF